MSLVESSNVYVKDTENKGLGVFSRVDFKAGDVIEKGIARRIDTDGNNNSYLFTWSEDRSQWAFLSGCATFYNTSLTPNVIVQRDFINDTFTIKAINDIPKNTELTHTYKSLQWRKCFQELNQSLNNC